MSCSCDQAEHKGCLDFVGVVSITPHAPVLHMGVGSGGFEGLARAELWIPVGDETRHLR